MIKTAIQWVLSLIFNVQMYVMMALMALWRGFWRWPLCRRPAPKAGF